MTGFRVENLTQSAVKTSISASDRKVTAYQVLPEPEALCQTYSPDDALSDSVTEARERIRRIIAGEDKRFLVIIGPCSIHDTDAGLEYARLLQKLKLSVQDRMELVMRVYFEKPRTTVGWKGLIMDPTLDASYNIPEGLKQARRFLLHTLELGLPTATELLDPITPQYIADLICWSAIGARTTESQTHRQMASGLSMPVGFKNATSGALDVAVNAIKAAGKPQTFLGISHKGIASAVSTTGNPDCHLILRGGQSGTNYDSASVALAQAALAKGGVCPNIIVDCSHDNSGKDPTKSIEVFEDVVRQMGNPKSPVIGAMLESNLVAGSQPFPQPLNKLVRGQSITDPCLDWERTEAVVMRAYEKLATRFA